MSQNPQSNFDKLGITFPEVMPLRLAALYADISEQRLRILVREGKIPGTPDEHNRWTVAKADLDAYLSKARASRPAREPRSPREPRGKAWVIKVPAADYDAVVDALATFGITLEPRYNYAKQREYRERRKQQGA